jgi:hypothetical protein
LSGRLFIHDSIRTQKAMIGNSDRKMNHAIHNVDNTQDVMQNNVSHIKSSNNNGPSEQAKAYIERIPDLSFILSSKLSINNNQI